MSESLLNPGRARLCASDKLGWHAHTFSCSTTPSTCTASDTADKEVCMTKRASTKPIGPLEPWAYLDGQSVLQCKNTLQFAPSAWWNTLEDGTVQSSVIRDVLLGMKFHTIVAYRFGLFFFFSYRWSFLLCFGVLSFFFSFLFFSFFLLVSPCLCLQNNLNFSCCI